MTTGQKVLLAGGLVGGAILVAKLVNVPSLVDVGTPSIDKINVGFLDTAVYLSMPVKNGSTIPIPFDSFQGWLNVAGLNISEISISEKQTIAAKATTQIPVKVNIFYSDLLTQWVGRDQTRINAVIKALKKGDFSGVDVRLVGTVFAGGGTIKVKVNEKMI